MSIIGHISPASYRHTPYTIQESNFIIYPWPVEITSQLNGQPTRYARLMIAKMKYLLVLECCYGENEYVLPKLRYLPNSALNQNMITFFPWIKTWKPKRNSRTRDLNDFCSSLELRILYLWHNCLIYTSLDFIFVNKKFT